MSMKTLPKLGFGLMRLPETDGVIDMEQVFEMVDAYMEAGMNYFDTAYVYHGGMSERVVKQALVERYPREAFTVATKLPAWVIHSKEDIEKVFNEQLERTGAGYIDYYLLHSLEDGDNYTTHEKFGSFEWAMKKKEEGLIRHFGFSFHGSPALLEEILDKHPEIEFVQIQLNYADWTNPIVQSGKLYEILHSRNIPMIIMEPVKGGMLANPVPEIEKLFKEYHADASAASWALRYVGSLDGIATILSGMSTREQMQDNLATFREFKKMTEEEYKIIEQAVTIMLNMDQIPCTACRYCCDGCPAGIKIPDVFRALNTARLYPEEMRPHFFYDGLTKTSGKASDCVACGQCEGVCPQHLPIVKLMQEAATVFDA